MTQEATYQGASDGWELAGAGLGLSAQQTRAIALIAQGHSDKQIAIEMQIAFGTLRTYLERARERTGASNRAGLVSLLVQRATSLSQKKEGVL